MIQLPRRARIAAFASPGAILLVEPGAVDQLSAALQRLIEQDALRHTLGRNARARAERCDIKQYSLELARIYRRLVASAPAPHTPADDGVRIT